jgi:tripartite-type tricarboxylate transporter receptor subunit TctC
MPYNAIKDFAPISRIANVPNLLVVNKNAPYSTVAELIAWGKANPGKLTFGSSGSGTTLHLSGELFMQMTGVQMTHIPYKGSSPAVYADGLAAGKGWQSERASHDCCYA